MNYASLQVLLCTVPMYWRRKEIIILPDIYINMKEAYEDILDPKYWIEMEESALLNKKDEENVSCHQN